MMDTMLHRRRFLAVSGDKYVKFADPDVARICIEQFSSDGKGVTYEDLAAVTSIWRVFSGKGASVVSFKELMYFTGLTSIGSGDFNGWNNLQEIGVPPFITSFEMSARPSLQHVHVSDLDGFLNRVAPNAAAPVGYHIYVNNIEITSIVFPTGITTIPANVLTGASHIISISIPESVVSIGDNAFANCSSLSGDLNLHSGITTIGSSAFVGCTSLNGRLTIPATVTSIGEMAFRGLTNIREAVVLATTPPTIGQYLVFGNASYKIYVPYSSDHSILDSYKTAQNWSVYESRIFELNPDGSVPNN